MSLFLHQHYITKNALLYNRHPVCANITLETQ